MEFDKAMQLVSLKTAGFTRSRGPKETKGLEVLVVVGGEVVRDKATALCGKWHQMNCLPHRSRYLF